MTFLNYSEGKKKSSLFYEVIELPAQELLQFLL